MSASLSEQFRWEEYEENKKCKTKTKVVIIGPSEKFLSGISYFTLRLSNALSDLMDVKTLLFRKMFPKRLFPGWRRVGEELTTQKFDERVEVYEIEFHEVVDPLEGSVLPIRIYSRVMGKLIRRLATRYVAHSNSDKELISKNYGIDKDKIEIIPHGIYDHYKKMDREEARAKIGIKEEFAILFFGLLRPYKGVKYLIEAYESLPEEFIKKSRLLIVGETWEDREVKELAKESKFSNKIEVVDRYVSDDEISLYFSASDVLVIPYTRAPQSGVAHIGMAFGMPIITSEVGGLKESLGKYEGTVFVQPGSAEDIAKALMSAFDERREFKFEAPEELTWKEIAKKWFELVNLVKEWK